MTKRQRNAIVETSDSEEDAMQKLPSSKKVIKVHKLNIPEEKMGSIISKMIRKKNTIDEFNPISVKTIIGKPNLKLFCKSISRTNINPYDWNHVDYILKFNKINRHIAETLVKLFDNDNTVPFIARYRKDQTGGLDADQLRIIKECYDRVKIIKHKADTVVKSIQKTGKLTPELENTVRSFKTINELEQIHALYKEKGRKTLAEKARDIGLGSTAESIMKSKKIPHFSTLINPKIEGLQNEECIKNGIINILADIICKDKRTFDKINGLREKLILQIQTKKIKQSDISDRLKHNDNDKKYVMYYDWNSSEIFIKPHQILAINRAEAEKVIITQIKIPKNFELLLKKNILEFYESSMNTSSFHRLLIDKAYHRAYNKSLKPAIIRRGRSEMNEKAYEASMEVFAMNLKQLLLTQPVRGKVILGIDPGFKNGCKLAIICEQGNVLETATIYPHQKNKNLQEHAANIMVSLVRKYKCSVLALGNSTACRETELFISNLIKRKMFGHQEVTLIIVDEAGASIYSCTTDAKYEFPKMDYYHISAVSIARRLQDPLAELVKIEPKHLGIGMYQHDLPAKQLTLKLDQTVTEVVSFVGVDINTASESLLRRIAGLSESKASNIIKWRRENGCFINRNQLRKVKGIGAKTFQQCAGFIRVMPKTALPNLIQQSLSTVANDFNYLDQTWIHPESYQVANAFVEACGVNLEELGMQHFINKVKIFSEQRYEMLAEKFQTNIATLEVIINALTMAKGADIRGQSNIPLFKKSLQSIDDLIIGTLLSGEVRNVTHFGVFVDIGVQQNGLIHVKNLKGEILKINQRIDVKVNNIDKNRGRIGLTLIKSY